MVRVGIDYRPALFSRSGIARSVRELALALAQTNATELELFAHGYQRPQQDELALAQASHGPALHRSRLPGRSLALLARVGIDASRLVATRRREPIALFHWTDYVYPPVRDCLPVTMTVHDVAFREDPSHHGEAASARLAARFEAALGRAAAVVCPTEATAARLRTAWPDAPAATVIPFGVDHVRRFLETAAPQASATHGRALAQRLLGVDEPYLIAVGTIEPRKNHRCLLDALDVLAKNGRRIPLLVVGAPGWLCEDVVARLREKARHPLRWLETADDATTFALVAGARCLLYPSKHEGFGFPPLEALECGVPAIVGPCSALMETCGDAGFRVDADDCEALAAAIVTLFDDDDLRRDKLEHWALRRPRFTWRACAQAHSAFWEKHA